MFHRDLCYTVNMSDLLLPRGQAAILAFSGRALISRDGGPFEEPTIPVEPEKYGITFMRLTEQEMDAGYIVIPATPLITIRTVGGTESEVQVIPQDEEEEDEEPDSSQEHGRPFIWSQGISPVDRDAREMAMLERTNPRNANLAKGRKVRRENVERQKQIKQTRLKNLKKARKAKQNK